MSAVAQEVSPPSGFPLTSPQTIFYAPESQRGIGNGVRESSDDATSKCLKGSETPKSTASTTYITTTPISTATTSPQTSCSSVPWPQQSGEVTNTDVQQGDVLCEEVIEEESEWKPYSSDRYVRADIQSSDVEKALEGGDYVIIEEEILEEVFVQEPGEKANVVRRIRRKVLKCKSKEDLRTDDTTFSHSNTVAGFPPRVTNLKKYTGSELLDINNIGSNKDSGIDCGANVSRMSEVGGERASYQEETHSVAKACVLSGDLSTGTIAGTSATTVGTYTDLRVRCPDRVIGGVKSNLPTVEDASGDSAGEATEDHLDGGPVEPSVTDKPQKSSAQSACADDEYEGDSEGMESKSEATVKKSPKEVGDKNSAVWQVVQQRKSGVDPLLSNKSTPRHQPRRFQDPYQLDRHAVWYGDKYKWMTGVPLPAWVMELRISDESAFTECMEHFQAFGRWPSDAELGPCPAAIPAAGGGFMHNPAAPLPTFVKLTRDRHLLNQYFAHFRVFGRWPRIP